MSRLPPKSGIGRGRIGVPSTGAQRGASTSMRPPGSRLAVPSQFPGGRAYGPPQASPAAARYSGALRGLVPGQQRVVLTGVSRPPLAGVSRTVTAEVSRPGPEGKTTARVISRTMFTGPAASAEKRTVQVEMTKSTGSIGAGPGRSGIARPGVSKFAYGGKPGVAGRSGIGRPEGPAGRSKIGAPPAAPEKQPSRLQRFDKTITAELSRKKTGPTTTTTTTSDTNLLEAADKLAKAEAAHTFAGAVAAAEAAAASVKDPRLAEEAAAEGARSFQAEIVDVVREDIPGEKSIQVLGYIGMTTPRYAVR